MLTGTVYRQERPLPRYVRAAFRQGFPVLIPASPSYRVDIVSDIPYDIKSASNVYERGGRMSLHGIYEFAAWQLADLTSSVMCPRPAPVRLHDQAWRLQTLLGPGDTRGRRHFLSVVPRFCTSSQSV